MQRGTTIVGFSATMAAASILALIACGGDGTALPETGGVTITAKAVATGLTAPVDATPDPAGKEVYFLATNGDGTGVFRVGVAGGAVTPVHLGAPFVEPRGISISSDGK